MRAKDRERWSIQVNTAKRLYFVNTPHKYGKEVTITFTKPRLVTQQVGALAGMA